LSILILCIFSKKIEILFFDKNKGIKISRKFQNNKINLNKVKMSSSYISLYIPSVKMSYTSDRVIYLFWKHGLGKVDRVDFVPIVKANDKECIHFKRAFLYVDPKSEWHPDIISSIEQSAPYKFYPNKDETIEHFRNEKEYWLILKNKAPVPYATTTLNVHQLANNLALLEQQLAEKDAKIAEMEAKFAEMESELAVKSALVTELQAVNNRLSDFNRNTVVEDNDTDEMRENMKAYNFVNSLENVLHMMKKAHNEYNGYIESEEVDYEEDDHYEEFSRSDRFNEDEDKDDLDKDEECCDYCQMSKKLVLYNWRCEDGGLCEDCANLLTKNDEA
jgi:hypothetical protein